MSDFEVCPVGTLQRLAQVEAERDALLEALKFCAGTSCATDANDIARAAIKAAEGEKT